MNICCLDVDCRLADYLEGALPEAQAAVIEHHLAECPRCARELEALLRTIQWSSWAFERWPPAAEARELRIVRQVRESVRCFDNFLVSSQLAKFASAITDKERSAC